MVGVIDYKAGNAPSVMNALRHIGREGTLVSSAAEALRADGLILPGVGSAGETMASLREMGLLDVIRESAAKGKPFLGICVGLQVLFEHSEEGDVDCLGLLPGCVRRFDPERVRVPQMGWNRVTFLRDNPILEGLPATGYFYFVNSYFVEPDAPDIMLGRAGYGASFCAMAARGNLYGAQFHVEKSADTGLRLLKNFAEISGTSAAAQGEQE